VGALLFLATAAFRADYALAVRATFERPNYWLMGAGVMSSLGQIFYFAALNESPMSRVALISSLEVFATLFLGYAFLRKRETLTAGLVIAAVLGVAGTAFVVGF
jgi:drug/metabolite transporter (DMT)-like permease